MAKNIQLLLTESVDNLGIVGDLVNVRTGYARNFLLPRQFATMPSDEAIKSLAAKRAKAEQEVALLREARKTMVEKMQGLEITLERSCNDLGVLYGAVTQQEIAKELVAKGFEVRPRDVRLPHAIKRIDTYEVHIKFESDLESVVKLWIVPDRKLEPDDKKPDMDFDIEGNLVEPGRRERGGRPRRDEMVDAIEGVEESGERPDKRRGKDKADRAARPDRAAKPERKGEKKGKG